jgi:uracil-DNA glycosylase family 4
MSSTRFKTVAAVERAITRCDRCPRLRRHCEHVARVKRRAYAEFDYWGKPVPGFGDPDPRLLIVGLAPAAHGANRTGRMFTGDSSGDWLYRALYQHGFANQATSETINDGLELRDCYITAAARCAPPGNRPTAAEMDSCSRFLEAEIALMSSLEIVLVLGRIGWERYLKSSGLWAELPVAQRPPFGHGAEVRLPGGPTLICSYHPSRQNTNTGRLTREMWHGVFARCRQLLGG